MLINARAQSAKITNDEFWRFYDLSIDQQVVSKGSFSAVVIANPFGPDKSFNLQKLLHCRDIIQTHFYRALLKMNEMVAA